jgi:hypothetical protein
MDVQRAADMGFSTAEQRGILARLASGECLTRITPGRAGLVHIWPVRLVPERPGVIPAS